MTATLEITCRMQRDIKVSPTWCDRAQYQQLCAGCPHNEGRKTSRHNEQKARDRAAGTARTGVGL